MTRRTSPTTATGLLMRAGAAVAIAVALATTTTACTAAADTVATEVEKIYEHSRGLDADAAELRRVRDTAILEWSEESGILEDAFSLESAMRAQRVSQTSGYGARDTALWARYQDFIEQQSQALKDQIRDRQTIDDVHAYYAQHPEQFEEQDHLVVEVVEWEGGRATATRSIEITAANVRQLQEEDDRLISVALGLAQDERATIDRGDGRFAQILCATRTDAGSTPFDEVVQAAAAQLASDIFESELDSRIAALR